MAPDDPTPISCTPAGVLFVIGTPIGNLKDITYRAVETLREVDFVACEDTRRSSKLLAAYDIQKKLVSYHEHNKFVRGTSIVERILGGERCGLLSDAGTPTVSDPGYRLIHMALEKGIEVIPIPGVSAPITALSASGLPSDAFAFLGYLPKKPEAKTQLFRRLLPETRTLIAFDSPLRIRDSLEALVAVMGDRHLAVARELTKIHEEILRGTAEEVLVELNTRPTIKGEVTLLIAGRRGSLLELERAELSIAQLYVLLREEIGMSRMDAMKAIARERGRSKQEIYAELLAGEKS